MSLFPPPAPPSPFRPLGPAIRRHFIGQAAIIGGAALTDATGSMWPLALTASAALMCTLPLVRQLAARGRARRSS